MTGNIQYLRTDRAIQSALLSLLGKKPFEKITVQDILDETPVSRATFYKHFHDKFEIVERIQDEILHTHTELRNSLAQATPEQYPTSRIISRSYRVLSSIRWASSSLSWERNQSTRSSSSSSISWNAFSRLAGSTT